MPDHVAEFAEPVRGEPFAAFAPGIDLVHPDTHDLKRCLPDKDQADVAAHLDGDVFRIAAFVCPSRDRYLRGEMSVDLFVRLVQIDFVSAVLPERAVVVKPVLYINESLDE